MHVYEVRPRKDKRGVDLISDVLPFGRLWYDEPNAIAMQSDMRSIAAGHMMIAWQQWRVADNKLRLDLFDRRYKVYDATRKFLAVIFREASFTDSQLFEFYAGTSDAEFHFWSRCPFAR